VQVVHKTPFGTGRLNIMEELELQLGFHCSTVPMLLVEKILERYVFV
jgi:hypothetical protein